MRKEIFQDLKQFCEKWGLFTLISIGIIVFWINVFTYKPESQIIRKLENYRQKVDVITRDIQDTTQKLQDKMEQKKALLEIMECELNQLIRLGEGLPIDDNYCLQVKSTSYNLFPDIEKMFLPLTYAEDTNTPDIAVTLDPFELQHNNWFNLEMENQKKIRLERLKICENAFLQSELELSDIYGQLPVVRCATFATLVYAYESNYGVSNICKTQKNCYGMKKNGEFITFNSYDDGTKYFAEKYFQWHYKKTISVFVRDWSMTDREEYTYFITFKFWKVYQELENLYFNL